MQRKQPKLYFRRESRLKVFPILGGNEVGNVQAPQGNDLAYCLQAGGDKHRGSYIKKDLMIRDGRDNRSCLRAGRTPELGVKGRSIRRLTPTECERLQGFEDSWTEGVSDSQRYKQCGNAVTVNVVQAIIRRLYG